jgi:endonuclease/exonuclease/phosphatase (EEP) superfamily protein YafD
MTRAWKMLMALVRAAAYALAGVALIFGLLAHGGWFSLKLDRYSHFAPIWFVAALAAGLWAAWGERGASRRALLVLATVGALVSGALILPELTRPLPPPAPAASPFRLRLIQFNTWGNLADPARIADWIVSERPDVVMAVEATEPLRQALIQRGFQCVRGTGGAAIFHSRQWRTQASFIIPGGDWRVLSEFARASFVSADGGEPFSVVVAHLGWPTFANAQRERARLTAVIDRYPHDRLIVGGDFNLTPWSFTLHRLDRSFGLVRLDRAIPTWPAQRRVAGVLVRLPAILPIDHVYAGTGWRAISVRRGPRLESDHYPLIADLALAEPNAPSRAD